ncbi:MAG: hypothetical protein K0B09_13100 [Bacteroidales bacterium]|nr:hypothetical protein [Bacteroidales bacterium]
MRNFKLTLWKFIKPSVQTIFVVIFFLCIMGVLMQGLLLRDGSVPPFLIGLTIVCVILLCVPNLILHINYYKEDRKKKIFIDFKKEVIKISVDEKEESFFFQDIVKVVKTGLYHSKSDRQLTTAPWRFFYYYKIEFQDKRFKYLTRFIIQDLESLLPNVIFEYEKKRYPFIAHIP